MRKLRLSVFLLAPLVALGMYACDQSAPAEPETSSSNSPVPDLMTSMAYGGNPLAGAWWATNLVVANDETFVGDYRYVMILRDDGTFSSSVGNDDASDPVLCKDPPQASCSWNGTYTYTATAITVDDSNHPDPEERGLDTILYVRCGGKLIYLGDEESGGMQLVFSRTGLGS
jgi:hypothetical protein